MICCVNVKCGCICVFFVGVILKLIICLCLFSVLFSVCWCCVGLLIIRVSSVLCGLGIRCWCCRVNLLVDMIWLIFMSRFLCVCVRICIFSLIIRFFCF